MQASPTVKPTLSCESHHYNYASLLFIISSGFYYMSHPLPFKRLTSSIDGCSNIIRSSYFSDTTTRAIVKSNRLVVPSQNVNNNTETQSLSLQQPRPVDNEYLRDDNNHNEDTAVPLHNHRSNKKNHFYTEIVVGHPTIVDHHHRCGCCGRRYRTSRMAFLAISVWSAVIGDRKSVV